jgi:glycosyltransferase involved in cell wall biosynthesis
MTPPGNLLRILIIIPCHNEALSIERVLSDIRAEGTSYETIVIDDGSSDRTYEVASRNSACLRLVNNLGIGSAVQTGIKYAQKNGFDYCVQVDGDGQHLPSQIPRLLETCRNSGANMVIGSRFLGMDKTYHPPFLRKLGIDIIRWWIKTLFFKVITDPTSGFRLMDRKAIEVFSAHYPHDFPEPISIAYGFVKGLSIQEVPVAMKIREFGKSSIRGLRTASYIVRVVGYLFIVKLGKHI